MQATQLPLSGVHLPRGEVVEVLHTHGGERVLRVSLLVRLDGWARGESMAEPLTAVDVASAADLAQLELEELWAQSDFRGALTAAAYSAAVARRNSKR